jgi:hypothetical protein
MIASLCKSRASHSCNTHSLFVLIRFGSFDCARPCSVPSVIHLLGIVNALIGCTLQAIYIWLLNFPFFHPSAIQHLPAPLRSIVAMSQRIPDSRPFLLVCSEPSIEPVRFNKLTLCSWISDRMDRTVRLWVSYFSIDPPVLRPHSQAPDLYIC